MSVNANQRGRVRQLAVAVFVSGLVGIGGICGISVAAEAQATVSSLSFDQALLTAQQRSRQLPAQAAAAQAAREMARAAAQRPDPTLTFGVNNLPVSGSDGFSVTRDFMTMRSVGVMQEFTRSAKLGARAARFEREADSADAAGALALADLRRDTALAWLEGYFQQRQRELLRALRTEAALQVDAADAAYRGGRSTLGDGFAARAALALIDDRLLQAEQQIAVAATRLARWVGALAELPLGELPATAPRWAVLRIDPEAIDTTLANHPGLAVTARQEARARAEVELAQRNRQADWSVALMFSQRGPGYSNMVSLNVSVPLQLDRSQRQDRELSAKLALAEQLREQQEEATREQVAQIRSDWQAWHGDRSRLALYDTTLLPLAAQRTAAATAAYRGGNGALSAVLDARRSEIETRIERLRLEGALASRWAQLEFLLPPAQPVVMPSKAP